MGVKCNIMIKVKISLNFPGFSFQNNLTNLHNLPSWMGHLNLKKKNRTHKIVQLKQLKKIMIISLWKYTLS